MSYFMALSSVWVLRRPSTELSFGQRSPTLWMHSPAAPRVVSRILLPVPLLSLGAVGRDLIGRVGSNALSPLWSAAARSMSSRSAVAAALLLIRWLGGLLLQLLTILLMRIVGPSFQVEALA